MGPRCATQAAVGAVVMALVLVACGHPPTRHAGPVTAATGVSPTTAAPTTTSSSPAAPGPLPWSGCPGHDGWECVTMQVPVDHAHPGATIGIALSRHRAVPTHRIGSLLVNPGGPGVSGITWAFAAIALLDRQLVDDFDIVGFDPRGVGASSPVRCLDGPALDRILHLDPDPTTPAGVDALAAGAKELADGCAARNQALLPHLATVDAAEDLDDIRAALGDSRLTYLGFSYGTYLGATYASLFPTHVRALVLDAAVDPTLDEGTISVGQAAAFEQNLTAFLDDCAAHADKCPFHATAGRTLRQTFDALAARLRSSPLPVAGGRTVGPAELAFGVGFLLYDRSFWASLGPALDDAQKGHGDKLLASFDQYAERNPDGTYSNSQEANNAVTCLDHPVPPSVGAFQTLVASTRATAPYFAGPVVWGPLACLYWAVPPVTHPGPLAAPGAPPVVVVGSTGDPATPYDGAVHLAAGLGPSAVLVTRRGQGHGGYPASACVRSDVDAYLIALTVPAQRDCTSDH